MRSLIVFLLAGLLATIADAQLGLVGKGNAKGKRHGRPKGGQARPEFLKGKKGVNRLWPVWALILSI